MKKLLSLLFVFLVSCNTGQVPPAPQESTTTNPYCYLEPAAPQGPILCSAGTQLNQTCADEAEQRFLDRIASVYASACVHWFELEQTREYLLKSCRTIYDLCVEDAAGTRDCLQELYNCQDAVNQTVDESLESLASWVDEKINEATTQYWMDLIDCCEEL